MTLLEAEKMLLNIRPEYFLRLIEEVDALRAERKELRSVLEQCLRRLETLNTGGPSEPDPTVVRVREVLAKGKA